MIMDYEKKRNMTQEEKQTLLQDLCARLPYRVKIEITWWVMGEGTCINTTLEPDHLEQLLNDKYGYTEIKPYLRPLSSMTEEEKHYIDNRWGADNYGDIITYSSYENGVSTVELADIIGFQDWLNRKMFDYRYLIPMGLAIKAPEEMYHSV